MNEKAILNSVPQFTLLPFINIFFAATWLISCITAVKLISIFGITLTGGFIVFPFTSALCTIIVEIYGYKNVRQSIWSGVLLNVLFVFFIFFIDIIPPSPDWKLQSAFNDIIISCSRIIIASLISFFLSFFLNSYIMSKMKVCSHNKSRSLIKRILVSNFLSISVDVVCFITLAFFGSFSFFLFLKLLTFAYVKRLIFEILFLPIIWYAIDKIKTREGFEIYDTNTNFNPFSLDNIYHIESYKKLSREALAKNTYKNFSLME